MTLVYKPHQLRRNADLSETYDRPKKVKRSPSAFFSFNLDHHICAVPAQPRTFRRDIERIQQPLHSGAPSASRARAIQSATPLRRPPSRGWQLSRSEQ